MLFKKLSSIYDQGFKTTKITIRIIRIVGTSLIKRKNFDENLLVPSSKSLMHFFKKI
jgi:hypothetical protein